MDESRKQPRNPAPPGRPRRGRRTFKRPLPANVDAPFKARQLVARAAEGLPGQLVDRATLVASELVSNAVQYGSDANGHIWFDVSADSEELTLTVDDQGAAKAEKSSRDSHYGLQIMRRLADRWTIDRNGSWKITATFVPEATSSS